MNQHSCWHSEGAAPDLPNCHFRHCSWWTSDCQLLHQAPSSSWLMPLVSSSEWHSQAFGCTPLPGAPLAPLGTQVGKLRVRQSIFSCEARCPNSATIAATHCAPPAPCIAGRTGSLSSWSGPLSPCDNGTEAVRTRGEPGALWLVKRRFPCRGYLPAHEILV